MSCTDKVDPEIADARERLLRDFAKRGWIVSDERGEIPARLLEEAVDAAIDTPNGFKRLDVRAIEDALDDAESALESLRLELP